MLISLKSISNSLEPTRVALTLSKRLPFYIVSDCTMVCDYLIRRFPDYDLLVLDVSGEIQIECQRCLHEFSTPYQNHTEIAICRDERTAEQLMDQYECIVSKQSDIDLTDIVIDELYLYAPEKHTELIECTH